MSKVIVQQAETGKAAVANPFFGKVEQAIDAVRRKAYELFQARGAEPGRELDDWLEAERQLFFIPEAELTENDQAFVVEIAVPGFQADDIEVIALPRELLVEAKAENQTDATCESKRLYRRFELSSPIDADRVTAATERGSLKIEAPKKMAQPIPVRAAAA